ncbi:MAG: fused MFS/spermidine synthase [Actinomycetota bacterium]|nr:fused MFS/spermidine synthase [Actinomycetota bacterium]
MNTTKEIGYKAIFWASGASGVAALIYEVVWFRALTNTIGGTIYSFSILMAAFLAGLAIGGRWGGIYAGRSKNLFKAFGLLQLGIGLFGTAVFYIVNRLEPVYGLLYYKLRLSFGGFTVAQMALVFFLLLVPTILMGANFPIVVKIWSERRKEIGRNAGDIYAINTWGSVLGTMAAGFILVPMLGLRWSNLTAGLINLSLAVLAFVFAGSRQLKWVVLPAFFSVQLLLLFSAAPPGLAFGYGVADKYDSFAQFKEAVAGLKTVFDKESDYGRVQVFKERLPKGTQLILVNGGRVEGSTGADAGTQRLVAYLPRVIHKKPRSLLNIGLGTGMTLATAVDDNRLTRLDNVEINRAVYEAVEAVLYPGLFNDTRLTAIEDDARHYLALTKQKYDIIISEPSYPTSEAQAHLFTQEFYKIVKNKLAKDGIFVQWLPGYLLNQHEIWTATKTLATVFPNLYVWMSGPSDIVFIIPNSDRPLDPAQLEAELKSNYKDIGRLRFMGGPGQLSVLNADPSIPINVDDLPRIEFSAARNKLTGVRQEIEDQKKDQP